jgi:hypothetical protein
VGPERYVREDDLSVYQNVHCGSVGRGVQYSDASFLDRSGGVVIVVAAAG